jgi:hypothetical protein
MAHPSPGASLSHTGNEGAALSRFSKGGNHCRLRHRQVAMLVSGGVLERGRRRIFRSKRPRVRPRGPRGKASTHAYVQLTAGQACLAQLVSDGDVEAELRRNLFHVAFRVNRFALLICIRSLKRYWPAAQNACQAGLRTDTSQAIRLVRQRTLVCSILLTRRIFRRAGGPPFSKVYLCPTPETRVPHPNVVLFDVRVGTTAVSAIGRSRCR